MKFRFAMVSPEPNCVMRDSRSFGLTGHSPEPRAAKWIRYDEKLQRIVESYDDYSDKMEYLKAIGNCAML